MRSETRTIPKQRTNDAHLPDLPDLTSFDIVGWNAEKRALFPTGMKGFMTIEGARAACRDLQDDETELSRQDGKAVHRTYHIVRKTSTQEWVA